MEWLLKEEKGKHMASNTAIVNQATDFLQYLSNNPHEREKLQDATLTDIVQAGKDAGYNFTESDLMTLIQRVTATRSLGVSTPTNEGCWPFLGK
jgi:predicted ribosomally synthesized peptide with nif11-like leader